MGQNFLIDENILHKIIEASNLPTGRQGLKPNDIVLEIGPGLGILTMELAKRIKKVIAVEKDKRMCEILREILDAENVKNVEIVNDDILKIFNSQFSIFNKFSMTNYKIVANIPYYLTSPLIRKFLEAEIHPEFMVLMIQKEVAERICALPPHMSILSIAVQFYAKPEIISYVSKNSFSPVPKVNSAIIKITPQIHANQCADTRRNLHGIDAKKFFELVKTGFSAKRKFLINNLKKLDVRGSMFEDVFAKIGLNPKVRAENLSINDWIRLYENIQK